MSQLYPMHNTIDQPPDKLVDFPGTLTVREAIGIIPPRSTRMRRVWDRARRLATDPGPLLLRGEFGVGKRVLSNLIHQWGQHPAAPYIVVRAAFDNSPGSPREAADRLQHMNSPGTLVFEEISDFTLELQGEMLALITANDSGRLSDGSLPPPVKIIATTSQDLAAASRKKAFREDLLSLLMDEALYLPPLRERLDDILALAEEMLAHFGRLYHRPALSLEPEAKLALDRHPWPGNVHELRNAIERAALSAKKPEIEESDFRLRTAADGSAHRSGKLLSLDAVEKQHILRVMRASPTLEEAARVLQVDITTLWRKRRRYGI